MSADSEKPTIFISYPDADADADADWARSLAEHLEEGGATTWLPERVILADESSKSEIQRGLRVSEYLVLILGPQADKSAPWVEYEWGAAGTQKQAFVISPRGSNVDAGELPIHARRLSFYRTGDAKEIARQINARIAETSAA